MANNRENTLRPSSTLGLPEKLFLFRECLQCWMWSSPEGLQLIDDLNEWRREVEPSKGDIKPHDNEELARALRGYLDAFERKKGWVRFVSYLVDPIAKAEEIHGGLLFVLSLEQSLESVIYHPLLEDVNLSPSSSNVHLSQEAKEKLKRNAAKINPLNVLDAPVPGGSLSATLQQSRQSMRWYHITCWFSSFRRVMKEIWAEIHPVQQRVQAARHRSNSSPQSLEGQQSAGISSVGLSQKNTVDLHLIASVAQHKLNHVQKQFEGEEQRLFGRQIEEYQLKDVWRAEVAGSCTTEQKWEWFGYRRKEAKERREYLLCRRMMGHLKHFENILSEKPINQDALDAHAESLSCLLWEACYLHRGEQLQSDGVSVTFWKEIAGIVKEFHEFLQASPHIPKMTSVLLPALNSFMKGKRPAWQTEHERAMQRVYQPLLSQLKTRFVEWSQNPKTHSSRTLENSRDKLEGNLAALSDILTESMFVVTQREAEGYRWNFQRYSREVEILLRGDVLPQREVMPSMPHPDVAPSSSSQPTTSTSSHSELDDIFINVRNGTSAQKKAFEVLGLSLDVEISAAMFRQHWHAALKEIRSPLMDVEVERERLDRVKLVIEAGHVINKLIDSERKAVREWRDAFEGELRSAADQLRQDIENLQARFVALGRSIEELNRMADDIGAILDRTIATADRTIAIAERVEKSSQESMEIAKSIGETLDRTEACAQRMQEHERQFLLKQEQEKEEERKRLQEIQRLENEVWRLLLAKNPELSSYREPGSSQNLTSAVLASLPESSSMPSENEPHGETSERHTQSLLHSKSQRPDASLLVEASIWSKSTSQLDSHVTTSEQASLEQQENAKPTRRLSHSG